MLLAHLDHTARDVSIPTKCITADDHIYNRNNLFMANLTLSLLLYLSAEPEGSIGQHQWPARDPCHSTWWCVHCFLFGPAAFHPCLPPAVFTVAAMFFLHCTIFLSSLINVVRVTAAVYPLWCSGGCSVFITCRCCVCGY